MTEPDLCKNCQGKDPDEWCDSCSHASMQPELARQERAWRDVVQALWDAEFDPDPVGALEKKAELRRHDD